MGRIRVEFHPAAEAEMDAAFEWYLGRSPAAASGFLREIDQVIETLSRLPELGARAGPSARRFALRRFPYLVVYCWRSECLYVLAVAHGRRRPGYWTGREGTPPAD